MKETTLIIETCAKCPHITHKPEAQSPGGYGYYCNYSDKWIPARVNLLKDIWEDCELPDRGAIR
jgi:hypothetical protein